MWRWITDPDHEVQALLVADDNDHIVGLAHYRTLARPLSASTGCFLDDLFIEPAARGTGAVDTVFEHLRGLAHDNGWSVVRWITAHDNHRARAKYNQVATQTTWITYDLS